MISKSQVRVLLPILVLLLVGALYQVLMASKTTRQQPELVEKVWRIDVIQAQRQSLAPSLTLYGRIESPELLRAAAPGGGVVEKVYVRDGARIKRGATLVEMDRRDFQASLLQAKADLRDVENQIAELKIRHKSDQAALQTERELLGLAAAEVDRLDKLQKQNLSADTALNSARTELGRQRLAVTSRELEVDSFPAKLKILQARADRATAQMDESELAMSRSSIKAPFDAIVSRVEVSAGDRVSLGQILVSLFPVDSLEIRAHLPVNYIDSVQRSISSGQTLQARIARRNDLGSFELLRLAGEAEATGIDLYFAVGKIDGQMRPGELLPLELELPLETDVIAIPYQAIYGNSRVYQVVEERLRAIDVLTVGQTRDRDGKTRVLVRSDELDTGDLIATTHLPNAVAGLKVSIHE